MTLADRAVDFFVLHCTNEMNPYAVPSFTMACAKVAFLKSLMFYEEKSHEELRNEREALTKERQR